MTGDTSKTRQGLNAYIVVTLAYWAFMFCDGALRMLVLLHFHTLGFSPIQLAYLFLLYEFMGMITNLSAGWISARYGLTRTLYAGLALQVVALLALRMQDPNWAIATSVGFVMLVQGVSGVAKDLAKMSAKSAVKVLAPETGGDLFRWVAVLTGSKNAIKGLGFLIGAALLGIAGFQATLLGMAVMLAVILVLVIAFMPTGLPTGRADVKFRDVMPKNRAVTLLSLARVFLFGARDIWFVVGIPIYFQVVLSDGSEAGNRAAFFQIGAFMAAWVIGYGVVQAWTPRLVGGSDRPIATIVRSAATWAIALTSIPLILSALVFAAGQPQDWLTIALVAGLLLFGFVFAVNSALHSYLILAFARTQNVTLDVGFYYMSNAAGRLLGTLFSGLSYQIGGLWLSLFLAGVFVAVSFGVTRKLGELDFS